MVQSAAPARIMILDSFRGIAAIWVVIFNLCSMPGTAVVAPSFLRPIVDGGGILASFFFALSGFCLCLSWGQNSDRSLFEFYLRRAFRILPLFYLVLLFQLLRIFLEHQIISSYDLVLSNVLMIFNFIPKWQDGLVWLGWALGVTIVFYLVFPILWGKAGRNFTESLKVFGICVIVSTISKATNIFFPEGEKYWQWSFLRFLPAFSSGLLVYSIWRDFYDSKTNKSQGSCYLVLGLALLAVRIWGDSSLLLSTVYFDSFSFGLIILGGILLRLDPGGCQILIQRWGRISYSVYLTHPLAVFSLTPVYKYMSDRLLSDSLLFFFSALLTLIIVGLISTLFRFYIEEPGEKFGDKIAERFRLVMQNKYSKAER